MQTYTFNRNGVKEEVPVERWAWGVVYKDGREFHQFAKDGTFHQVGEIEQEHVKLWVLYKTGTENKRIDILLPDGAKVIHKYRNYIFNASTDAETQKRVYIFGYKLGDKCFYNFVLPDDRIVQSCEDDVKLTDVGLTE